MDFLHPGIMSFLYYRKSRLKRNEVLIGMSLKILYKRVQPSLRHSCSRKRSKYQVLFHLNPWLRHNISSKIYGSKHICYLRSKCRQSVCYYFEIQHFSPYGLSYPFTIDRLKKNLTHFLKILFFRIYIRPHKNITQIDTSSSLF